MLSFSMNPVCAFSCHVGRPTVLCVAFVEQQIMLAFCRSYEVDVFNVERPNSTGNMKVRGLYKVSPPFEG